MYNLGHEVPDYGCEVSSGPKDMPKRRVFPEIRIRTEEDGNLPELPSGEFYAIIKAKKVGSRDPIDDGADKSCDIAVIGIQPIESDAAEDLMHGDSDEDDNPNGSAPLRKAMRRMRRERSEY